MKKENLKPKMTRMTDTMKSDIKKSADTYNEGIFDRELRDLIRIGLKNRKREGKIKQKDLHENDNKRTDAALNLHFVSKQRELLIAFCEHLTEQGELEYTNHQHMADTFLKSN